MMRLLLFGARTPSGAALLDNCGTLPVLAAGRRKFPLPVALPHGSGFLSLDLLRPEAFEPPHGEQKWISFAPIWHLSTFLNHLKLNHPDRLLGLRSLVACSSSSSLTKLYAANGFDRSLVRKLQQSEDRVLQDCLELGVPCRILAPTLIYGEAGGQGDRNLSRLLTLMRQLPILPVPARSGLRQPIHARQLAAVALNVSGRLEKQDLEAEIPTLLALGGDESLDYTTMLERLRQATPPEDRARCCQFLPLPPRLWLWLANPLLLLSPKAFEALQRTQVDLAGFRSSHQLTGGSPQSFPVRPLALGKGAAKH